MSEERLIALCEALELERIDDLLNCEPEYFKAIGEHIASSIRSLQADNETLLKNCVSLQEAEDRLEAERDKLREALENKHRALEIALEIIDVKVYPSEYKAIYKAASTRGE